MRKIILFIVYGEKQIYYDGAKFSILTYLNWVSTENSVEIVVLTEKPEEFLNFPISIFKINTKQKKDWSLDGKYHFRIKNRGICHVIDKLSLKDNDKLLFFDADTYFHKSPIALFKLIDSNQALFFINEGLINRKKRFKSILNSLKGKTIKLHDSSYKLKDNSSMWGALMIGIMPCMRDSFELADELMQSFLEIVPSHTIEQFSLSEVLSAKYKLVEGKKYVSLYSTSGKKEYAKKVLREFFNKHSKLNIQEQIKIAQLVNFNRPLSMIIKQHINKLKKNA